VKRTLNVGDRGDDVAYAQRLLRAPAVSVSRVGFYVGPIDGDYGDRSAAAAKRAKYELGFPARKLIGNFGTQLERYLRGLDPLPALYRRRRKKRLARQVLIEPNQGWGSLDRSLWEAYSEGPRRGFLDLGTYVNKPGDHGVGPPCFAFDLGRKDRFLFKGWNYLKARRLALWYVKNHGRLNIEYVILGRRIWSRTFGWHAFTRDSSHDFHIHVSGHRT
jgi:hypothetical protein